MIPHMIIHPTEPIVLQFLYDFDEACTTLRTFRLEDGSLTSVSEHTVDRLLRYPQTRGTSWYCAVMEVREFGEPAFVERWSWETGERVAEIRIPVDQFGLMGLRVDAHERLAIIDREFGDMYGTLVVHFPSMEVIGRMLLNANLVSAEFDPAGRRIALVHTDQGSAEAQLWTVDDQLAHVRQFAERQTFDDFHTSSVQFIDNEELLIWTFQSWSGKGQVGVYSLDTGEPRFISDLPEPRLLDDEGDLNFLMDNTEVFAAVDGRTAIVGDGAGVSYVDLDSGAVRSVAIDAGMIVQIRRCGERHVAVDHQSKLFVLPQPLE